MKTVSAKYVKDELSFKSHKELVELCLRLSRFKRENKELLTYLLFVSDQDQYIRDIQAEIDLQFEEINKSSYYLISKSVRRILRTVKKHIRYTLRKETEAELLIYFCSKLKSFQPSIIKHKALINIYDRQIDLSKKAIAKLHEDLQYDYNLMLEELN